MSDPEDVTELRRSDFVEVEVDEAADDERPQPIEADPADVLDQRRVEPDDDEYGPADESGY